MDLRPIAEKYLKDNTATLEGILKKFDPIFKKIDSIKKIMVKLDASNTAAAKEILTKLTGYYMEVIDVHSKIESLVKNKKVAYYYSRKVAVETAGEKFSSAPVEREADLYVADERRVRDIFAGKVAASIEGIRTCRSIILQKEANKEQQI